MKIKEILISLSESCEYLVFQIGYNWKGKRDIPLFDTGTKLEIIEFLKRNISDYYEFCEIGIGMRKDTVVTYQCLDDTNSERFDEMGEFLNRPLFILKSRR